MKAALPVFTGALGFLFGAVVAAALVSVLYFAVGPHSEPRGGEAVFKIAWTAAAFGIGPLGAVAFCIAVGDYLRLGSGVLMAVVAALVIYGLVAWIVADWLSFINDCGFGVTWPTSVGCGPD
jgi:hypothetical protein